MKRKTPKVRSDAAQGRQRLHVRLAPETLRRLRVACAMEDVAPGPYLERLIDAAARRWVVQDRPREGGEGQGGEAS